MRSSQRKHHWAQRIALIGSTIALATCANDSGIENAGAPCGSPADCYEDVDHADLQGEVVCLDRVPDGYCTHLCQTDADCCAVGGECDNGLPQVCAPFESTNMSMCFLSCEAEDIDGGDADAYCHDHAHPAFNCRSTGGGTANRKVCTS
jgi:hypothetical protein